MVTAKQKIVSLLINQYFLTTCTIGIVFMAIASVIMGRYQWAITHSLLGLIIHYVGRTWHIAGETILYRRCLQMRKYIDIKLCATFDLFYNYSAKYEDRHYVEPIHDETNNWPWTLFNKWSVHSNSDHPLNVNNETLKYIKGGRLLHSGLATVTSSPDIDDMIKVVPELRNVVQ
eukprot:451535_1